MLSVDFGLQHGMKVAAVFTVQLLLAFFGMKGTSGFLRGVAKWGHVDRGHVDKGHVDWGRDAGMPWCWRTCW